MIEFPEHSSNIDPKQLIIAAWPLVAKQHRLARLNTCPRKQNRGDVAGKTGQVCV